MAHPPLIALLLPLAALSPGSSAAQPGPAAHCADAANDAALEAGIPPDIMQAVSLTETGRSGPDGLTAWPWAVNMGGDSHWPASRAAAVELVTQALTDDRSNIDIGCFQLNLRWHAAAFASVDDMIDPVHNARYAAAFLRDLHARAGNWEDAVGAYHSATPAYAERYLARFQTVLAGLHSGATDPVDAEAPSRNSFPLLRAGASGQRGSLVPLTLTGRRLIGE